MTNPIKDTIRDFGVNRPIILEHHGIKEIISIDDLDKFVGTEPTCKKCKHYNCVCELHG